jgi:hypothetical protein
MRASPAIFYSTTRIQWLCAALDVLLGQTNLSNVPALMSGYGSVTGHPSSGRFAAAAFSLRQLGLSVASEIQLRQAVLDAVLWEDEHHEDTDYSEPPYEIMAHQEGFPFRRRSGSDRMILAMVKELVDGLRFERWTTPIADSSRPMVIKEAASGGGVPITIDMSCAPTLASPPKHDHSHEPRGPIVVQMTELEAVARRMDLRDDADPQRQKGNWAARLREADGSPKFHILWPDRQKGTLEPTNEIRLDGLRHLIGLPGTGKTTIIILLLMWLDENHYRVTVLLPSIEASLNLLGDLRFYGADVGLLVGQSPQARIDHARRFSERVGADETHGFGRTAPGADLMGLNCALAAFDSDDEGHEDFPHLQPPCRDIYQRGLKRDGSPNKEASRHLCPLGGWCGRLKPPRELVSRRIWLGHVLSMDTRIGPHFSDDRLRYFEAIAMSCDLVIVDEVDGAQAVLDRKAISSLDLTGSEGSYEHALNRDLFVPISVGRNDITSASVQSYSATAADFGKLNRGLVAQLQRDLRSNGSEGPVSRFKDTFVTGNSVLTVLFSPEDFTVLPADQRLTEELRFNAIRAFWDGTMRAALFRRTDDDDTSDDYDFDPERIARDLGCTKYDVDAAAVDLAALIRDWISEPLPTRRDLILETARIRMLQFVDARTSLAPHEVNELFRFLVGVTAVIFQFLSLIPAQQAMVAEGIGSAQPQGMGLGGTT